MVGGGGEGESGRLGSPTLEDSKRTSLAGKNLEGRDCDVVVELGWDNMELLPAPMTPAGFAAVEPSWEAAALVTSS